VGRTFKSCRGRQYCEDKMLSRRALVLGSYAALATPAKAQQELTLIVPSGIGGSADITSRLLSAKLTESGLPTKVLNRSAGAGVEGTLHVLRSSPDSGSILVGGPNGLLLAPARENLPYTVDSFDPICMFSTATFVLVVKSTKADSVKDLLEQAKMRYVSVGTATSEAHYLIDTLFDLSGSKLTHVPYRSAGDAARDLLAGVIDAAYISLASIAGAVEAGEVKLLVQTTDDGSALRAYPNVPHISSIGFNHPALYAYHWHGLYVSKNAPRVLVNTVANVVREICADSGFISAHDNRGMVVRYMQSNELRHHHNMTIDRLVKPYMKWLENNR
jgi:tripartite-type tricarboxylate transporter receptor subunit TctC